MKNALWPQSLVDICTSVYESLSSDWGKIATAQLFLPGSFSPQIHFGTGLVVDEHQANRPGQP